jgi:hypothetical protein
MQVDDSSQFSLSRSLTAQARRYALADHSTVEGWLGLGAISTMLLLDQFHRDCGETGSVCEIGVHHGRLFILLALLRREGEIALAVDIFENQHLNVDFSGSGNREAFWSNIDRCVGNRTDIVALSLDSLTLSPGEVHIACDDQGIRLFSVDGGHTTRHLLNDVKLAEKVLSPHGIVIVDDFYNPDWPGVNEGVVRYLMESPGLVPFCYGDNKLYLCNRGEHATMLDWTQSKLVSVSHHVKEVELCGMRAFHCHPPAPAEILIAGNNC